MISYFFSGERWFCASSYGTQLGVPKMIFLITLIRARNERGNTDPLCPNCAVSSSRVNVGGSLVCWSSTSLRWAGCLGPYWVRVAFKAFGLRYPFVWFVGFESMFGSWPFGVLIWFKEAFLFSSWGCDKTLTKSNAVRKGFLADTFSSWSITAGCQGRTWSRDSRQSHGRRQLTVPT